MVMAESERATGSLTNSGPDPSASTASSRLQWLKQRREALQEKLVRKNNELKNLCIDEAELTGILPPEIPLDPGESPPIFRKRIGTSFTFPQNLINKIKTNQVEESALELERQVQAGIATAALAIVNDLTESKAVRRKHRSIYQQSQRRLKELETRLNFIRQGYGQLSRSSAPVAVDSWQVGQVDDDTGSLDQLMKQHKTKKPRPPLEMNEREDTAKLSDKKGWQETVVNNASAVPVNNEWHRIKPHYIKQQDWHSGTLPVTNTIDRNDNSDVYVYNEQPRVRTYSHGNWDDSVNQIIGKTNPIDERTYRKITDMYTLDADNRNKELINWQQKKIDPKYSSTVYNQRNPIDPIHYKQSQQFTKSKTQRAYYQDHQLSQREKTSPDINNVQNNYSHYHYQHTRVNHLPHTLIENQRDVDHDFVTKRIINNKGRKTNDGTTWSCGDENGWYGGGNSGIDNYQHKENFGSLDRRKHAMLREQVVAARGHVNNKHRHEHPPPPPPPLPPPPHARMLLRTQSLGSVETWQPGASALPMSATMSRNHHEPIDKHREKEKEWYETSMDLGYSPQQLPPTLRHYPRSSPSPSSISSSPKLLPPTSPIPSSPSFNEVTMKISQSTEKDLEIPAETSTQTLKYQPYREVTKPFEMSDFYKYSTKFRKKNEQIGSTQRLEHSQSGNKIGNNNNTNYTNNNMNIDEHHQVAVPSGAYLKTVQRRVYDPQMITRTVSRKNDGSRKWSNSEECRVPPNDSTVV